MYNETFIMTDVNQQLKDAYDNQYSFESKEWRRIGALGKVRNILDVSKHTKFNNLVDIGAGDGSILELLSKNNFCPSYTAVEISNSGLEQIRIKKIQNLKDALQFDGYILPFKDHEFDVAVCSHVLEHVEYPRILLREIKRISKYQIFEIPIDFSFKVDKKVQHFLSYGHINIFNPALFRFLLKSEGFEIIKDKNALYDKSILRFQQKRNSVKYWILATKRLIWQCIPLLLKIKPNTYTVFTRDLNKNLKIF
jgi:ubiquinone/menaquinone biosynthesis C-methylase UbiE